MELNEQQTEFLKEILNSMINEDELSSTYKIVALQILNKIENENN